MSDLSCKVYLDACCLNRPFDDLTQTRIYLEAEAVILIIQQCQMGNWKLIKSEVLIAELSKTPDLEKLGAVQKLLDVATVKVKNSKETYQRAYAIKAMGFGTYDSFHIASAEKSKADVFLTTDDRLLNKAKQYSQAISVKVDNPVQWLSKTIQIGGSNHEN
jgi:predicted nucleic acid-binding protein